MPEEEIPEWAMSVNRSVNMVEGSEDHTAWKLKYGSIENWWQQLVEQVTKEDKLD
jgi:hypothetical protein